MGEKNSKIMIDGYKILIQTRLSNDVCIFDLYFSMLSFLRAL